MEIYDYQIIANLLSGKGLSKIKLEELEKFLDKKGLSYRTLSIAKQTPISLIPTDGEVEIKKGVICLGGDGTVSETIEYLIRRKIKVPISIIPTGTANFIASAIGVCTRISYDKLLEGEVKKFDLGVCQAKDKTHYFLIGIGLGFEQKFLELAKEKSKKLFGIISYCLAAFWELFKLKPLPYQLVLENQKINFQTSILSVLNFRPVISRFLPLFKEKDINQDDGFLDIFYIEHKNYLTSFLGIVFFHLLGRYNFGLVKRIKTKKVAIYSEIEQKTQIDGEIKGKFPLKISIISEGVKFLV